MAPGGAPTDSTKLVENTSFSSNDTTTLSTIAVRAGVNASIVVALLKSGGFIQMRVDEMRPKLLSIGNSSEETQDLLRIHDDLIQRLREKDDQVAALLTRTDGLGAEKSNPKEALVYDEMARNLRETWRSLNRQLILRGYLLRETLHFYQMAHSHEQLAQKTIEIVEKSDHEKSEKIKDVVDKLINDIIDTTAAVVDLGSSVISQIRTLGQFDDNPERPQEILESCVLIENVMLRVAADWERSETAWQDRKSMNLSASESSEHELARIEQWLEYSEKRVKALNESGQKNVLSEGNKHVTRLRDLAQLPSSDGSRISHLSGRIEEFLHYLKTRMNRSNRIQSFLQAAKSMMSQLSMMVSDMRNANGAMAGELAPLAKQKTVPLITEGKDIAAKEVLSYEEQRLVRQYCDDLDAKLREIEEIAKTRKSAANSADKFQSVKNWLDGPAMAFLAQKGDMGGNLSDARDFVAAHQSFAADVVNRDTEVMTLLSMKSKIPPDEESHLSELVKNYEKIKDLLENRIQIGTTYVQVHKFGKDLEGSFDALQALLENNQEYTNEKVSAQIANVFQMIQETLSQEKHQAEKFVSNATQIGKSDEWLNIDRAQEAVRNMITDHENRFKYVQLKWDEWQRDKNVRTKVEKVMEEIQMWQTDVLEFIGKVDNSTVTSKEEIEEIKKKIEGFKKAGEKHTYELDQLKSQNESEEQISRINVLLDKQEYIKNRLEQLKQKLEITSLLKIVEDVQIWQEEMVEIIRNLNQIVSTQSSNKEQFEQVRHKTQNLKKEIEKKSEHLESCKTLSENATFQSQITKTIENQEQIRRTTLELEEKIELTKLVKIVQEIQMWQEEAIEIIRMLDRSEPSNIQEANELIDRVRDLRETVEQKMGKIQEVKQMSSVPEFVEKIGEIEQVQEQIKHLTVELEEKLGQQKLVKITEEIQMWQEEMIEIIKMFDSTPMQTVQEQEELQEKVKMVNEAIKTQQPKIEEVVRKAVDEPVRTQIAKVVERQKEIREMAKNLERKSTTLQVQLTKPQQSVEQNHTIELTTLEKTEVILTPEERRELEIMRRIVEEIQMWQEEIIEVIRLVQKSPPRTLEESESLVRRVTEISNTVEAQNRRIEDAERFTKDENFTKTVHLTKEKQEQVEQLVRELKERALSQNLVVRRQEETLRAPQILTPLKDGEVEEGARFEFAARIVGEPEPVISWLKDGIDVKSNIDYRQEFVNGVATLVIEESFIEDTARYTVKATNDAGSRESSANLMVKSRSAMSSTILEEDKPRFVRQMSNIQVAEGETASLDCIVVGRPEPEIAWFKEETPVKENERVRLRFEGDHCQMIVEKAVPIDTGIYTVRARNVHGEVANFCQLRVVPKKKAAPPQTPPKPRRVQRPPSIQPALTNSTWQEGDTATLKVFTHGEPTPRVTWKFNEQPLQRTSRISITEEEDGWCKLTIKEISPANAGMYTAIAVNEMGEAVTGATVHVQPSATRSETMEHHLQEEIAEIIGQPVQQITTTKKLEEFRENIDFPQRGEPERIIDDKRWVEVIEQHFEEHLSQKSLSPIPQINERRRIEQEQRWVDTIDEIWSPEREIKETNVVSGSEHYSTHRVNEPRMPVAYQTSTSITNLAHVGQSHDAIQPYTEKASTTDESVKAMNIATIRQSPQREIHKARTTPAPASEHVAAIRKTPVRETLQTSITKAPSVENVAKIRQSPVPESHRSTITRRSPSVENVAKIRQSPAPETHTTTITRESPSVENIAKYQPAVNPEAHVASTVSGQGIANIAQIHTSTHPEKHGILKEAPKIDRIDDILAVPRNEKTIKTVTQTISTTGDIDKQYQGRDLQQTSTVTETQSGEGWVQHQHQDFVEPQKSTVVVRKLDIDENEHISRAKIMEQKSVKTAEEQVNRQESRIPVRQQPKSTTTVTETTSGEGWVKKEHQDLQNPHLSTVIIKRLGIEEEENIRRQNLMETKGEELEETVKNELRKEPNTTTTVTETVSGEGWIQHQDTDMTKPEVSSVVVKRLDIETGENKHFSQSQTQGIDKGEEYLRSQKIESRIPLRREPKTNTTVTETTTGEGWIQDVHTDMSHPNTSTVMVKRLGIDEEMIRRHGRPISVEMRKQVDDDNQSSIRQRDSFVMASDVEGFWTDGAYTASPTPPPIPMHRSTAEENMQRIGLMRSTTEPEFIKPFEKEYTIEEGGRIAIECILVGNPKPSTRFFFNNRQITEKSEFLKVCHVNDTYSIIISPVKLEHAGHYKLIAENKRGMAESLTVLHVRARYPQRNANPTEHTTVEEEFAMFEYEQRRPLKHDTPKMITPPPAKRIQAECRKDEEHLETYDMEGRKSVGHPPHFTQTLVSAVVAHGDSACFEGIVTGWPAPSVEWTLDGKPMEFDDVKTSNIGGRVSITFATCDSRHSGKYMCTARNSSGVATSRAQLVVRPKTIAPDFIQRLISEEVEEGTPLKWTVRVTGDPMPKVTWLRDGYEIPNCDEVRIVNNGDGLHTLLIVNVESADSGQFTCLAENIAGEARSTADLVVRQAGTQPGHYFHVTKVTQEKQSKGSQPTSSSAFAIETPKQSEML